MRRVMQICLTLVGLALADGTSAWADEPHLCQACQEKYQTQQQLPQTHRHWFRSARMCTNCMQARQMANSGAMPAPPMLLAGNEACLTCQPPVAGGMAAGYAMSGQPMPSNPNEPTPIGVMQATYRPAAGPGAAGMAPGHAVSGSGGALGPNDPAAMMNGRYVNTLAPTPSRRPHVLAHLFGFPTVDSVRDHWGDRAADTHASIPYGPYNSNVSELPSSMVYGR